MKKIGKKAKSMKLNFLDFLQKPTPPPLPKLKILASHYP